MKLDGSPTNSEMNLNNSMTDECFPTHETKGHT